MTIPFTVCVAAHMATGNEEPVGRQLLGWKATGNEELVGGKASAIIVTGLIATEKKTYWDASYWSDS